MTAEQKAKCIFECMFRVALPMFLFDVTRAKKEVIDYFRKTLQELQTNEEALTKKLQQEVIKELKEIRFEMEQLLDVEEANNKTQMKRLCRS